MSGGGGNDWIFGDGEHISASETPFDLLAGNDTLFGGSGNDFLFGDALSADAFTLGDNFGAQIVAGADTIIGGSGDDVIVGDFQVASFDEVSTITGGNDLLTGGSGNDTFFFLEGSAEDVITDFRAGAGSDDVLDVTGYLIDGGNFETVLGKDLDGNAVLTFNADDSIMLLGVGADDLHADDFVPI